MPGRSFVCAIVTMGIALPAAAGERPGYSPLPDALRLLMQDDDATFGARTPTLFAPADARRLTAAHPRTDTLTAFETLTVPAAPYLADLESRAGPSRYAIEAPHPGFTDWPLNALAKPRIGYGARAAIDEAMTNHARPPRMRGRSRLDTMLTFRLDGERTTRSLSMRGPASVLNFIPVR